MKRRRSPRAPRLSHGRILEWADAYHDHLGLWPVSETGPILEQPAETWTAVRVAMKKGTRGLPKKGLARLLHERRGTPFPNTNPRAAPLTRAQILRWARAHFQRTGYWPTLGSGLIPECPGTTWRVVDKALNGGLRGLSGRTSLAKLLGRTPGSIRRLKRPRLSASRILAWADAHFWRTGAWPTARSGPIMEAPGETWKKMQSSLQQSRRGLKTACTLPQFLERHRGVAYMKRPRGRLTIRRILDWADVHHRRTGEWPTKVNGPIPGTDGETWGGVRNALRDGRRGLRGDSSLALLLALHRNRPYSMGYLPGRELTEAKIVKWVKTHHQRTGRWPTANSGPVLDEPGETWSAINSAVATGGRGMSGDDTLPRLIDRHFLPQRGKPAVPGPPRRPSRPPPLLVGEILEWARAHKLRTGKWPHSESGRVEESDGLTWRRIDEALRRGSRGLRPGGSVVRLLHQRLGVPLRRQIGEPLTQKTIVNWAKTYHARTGTWPSVSTKERIHETGERWGTIDQALKMGHRGLPGGSSLARLLGKEKGSIRSLKRPQLHIHEVLQWADAFRERTSRWPRQASGQIPEAPGLTWMNVNHALFYGNRGFRGGSSLARLLTRYRGAMPVKRKSEGRTLSIEQIKSWILTHHASTGKWPGQKSGSVIGGPDITWSALYRALNEGRYGLPKGIRMASLRPVIEIERAGLRLSVRQIVLWARAHHRRHGFWPTPFDGRIPDAPGETWLKVEDALRRGTRGLPGGSSLAKLLKGRAKPRPMSAGNGGSRRRSATAHE